LERRLNIVEIGVKGGKLLGLWKQTPREGSYLEKRFNIVETCTKGRKLLRKRI
jgi:hypothetical protein